MTVAGSFLRSRMYRTKPSPDSALADFEPHSVPSGRCSKMTTSQRKQRLVEARPSPALEFEWRVHGTSWTRMPEYLHWVLSNVGSKTRRTSACFGLDLTYGRMWKCCAKSSRCSVRSQRRRTARGSRDGSPGTALLKFCAREPQRQASYRTLNRSH